MVIMNENVQWFNIFMNNWFAIWGIEMHIADGSQQIFSPI